VIKGPLTWVYEHGVKYLNLRDKTNKCTSMIYVLSLIFNYQQISVSFTISIREALQEY